MHLLSAVGLAIMAGLAVLWYVWRGGASGDRKGGLVAAWVIITLIAFSLGDYDFACAAYVGTIIVVLVLAGYDRLTS